MERYGDLKFRIDETIFAAYDKAEMRKAKILVIASSDFVSTSKSFFWPDVIMLAGTELYWIQSISMAIGVQRQTAMNPITIVFAGNNHRWHSRGLLGRLREPATAEATGWPAIKDVLQSMGDIMDLLKEGGLQKITLKPVFVLSPGYAHLLDGLKVVHAIIALLSAQRRAIIACTAKSGNENKKSGTTSIRIASSMARYLERHERTERPLATHVVPSVGIGAVEFQQTTQDETRNRQRSSSDSGYVK